MDGERDRWSLFPVRAAIILMGMAGITSQTVLLRELLVQYHGNEFSVGVIIGNWVAASALGAFLAGLLLRQTPPAPAFVGLTAFSSLLFPLAVSLCRTFKPLVGIQPGMGVTFVQIFSSSLLLLLLPAALQGGLFVIATRLYAHRCGDVQTAPGRSYALDAGGTLVGGLLCSALLLPRLNPFGCAALVLLCNGGVTLWLSVTARGNSRLPLLPLTMLLASLLLVAGGSFWLEVVTRARQWQGREVVSSRNTPYQNITVIRDREQLTVYTDGLPFITLPDADIASLEELAHIPALAHPRPRTVLLLGGSSGGLPAELLKHPSVERIDCLELDPSLLSTVASLRAAGGDVAGEERVSLRYHDARRFLTQGGEGYDLILLNLSLPLSLQANRNFSRELLVLARSRLLPGGVLALAAPGSTAYYSPEQKELTAILLATIASVFPRVEVLPGESNLFLASADPAGGPLAAPLLSRRLQERDIRAALITPEHLSWRLDPSPSRWFAATMSGVTSRPNRDFSPLLLTAGLTRSTGMQNPWLKPLLTGAGEMGAVGLAAIASLTILLALLVGSLRGGIAIPCLVASSGMTAMLLELVLIFVFQISNGVMFQAIALLIALFMGGLWAGSLFATKRLQDDLRLLLAGEGGLLLLSLVLFGLFAGERIPDVPSVAVTAVIMPLLVATGFCAGMEFPPAVRLTERGRGAGEGVGTVYAADLFGGWVGGLFGALLLPFLGFAGCCALLVGLKLAGMVLLHRQGKMCRI